MRKPNKTRVLSILELLEDRVVPFADWPFPGGAATNPIIGTYGQYQEVKSGAEDLAVHFHEGVDFAVSVPNEAVRAVETGYVHQIYNIGPAFERFVVIRDDKDYTAGVTKKWTYKHIIPDGNLLIDAKVTKGVTFLGKVVEVSQA